MACRARLPRVAAIRLPRMAVSIRGLPKNAAMTQKWADGLNQ
jgi:hypothetical protein